jgi:NAD(P)-dependent dehydrogenase (short-subunit alcohol dehydrogenase family)
MLKGKIAIVTGAAGGMGVAHVRALAEAGAAVVAVDIEASGATAVAEQVGRDTIAAGLGVTELVLVGRGRDARRGAVRTRHDARQQCRRARARQRHRTRPADWDRVLAVT